MAAAKYDIQTETGAGLSLALVYKDQNDAVIDISGATITMKVTDNVFDETADSFPGTFTTDGTDGAFNIQLTATSVDGLAFRNGRYVIELTGAPEVTLLYGKFQVKRLKY